MIKCIFIICAFFCARAGFSQTDTVKPLTIGSIVPDMSFQYVKNGKTANGKLSDYKGKIIILDFWHTYCSSCIESWPKLQKLQDKFKDSIQILLVNNLIKFDTKDRLKSFFSARRKNGFFIPDLPFINHDSILTAKFFHKTDPHIVWLNRDLEVTGISEGMFLNEKNIAQALKDSLNIALKREPDVLFDSIPLLVNYNGGAADNFVFRSVITNYMPVLSQSLAMITYKKNADDKLYGLRVLNSNLLTFIQIYNSSLSKDGLLLHYNLDMKVKDTNHFISPADPNLSNDYNYKYKYCYEGIVPKNSAMDLMVILKTDVEQFFNIVLSYEERKIKGLALRLISAGKLKRSNGVQVTNAGEKSKPDNHDNYIWRTLTLNTIVSTLNGLRDIRRVPIIFNETNNAEYIELELDAKTNINSTEDLNRRLEKYGLKLEETEKTIKVLVVRDKTTAN